MFFNTEAPPKLDIFAFTGYKFVALSMLVLAHILGLGEITILYYLKFIIVSTAQVCKLFSKNSSQTFRSLPI